MKHDLKLALMAGIDIPIPELHITIHPPFINEIALMGEKDFFMGVQYLCLEKEQLIQDEFLLASLSNFQVLMKVLGQSQDKNKKNIIETLLLLLFPTHKAVILPNSIILSAPEIQPTVIDDNNFNIFQDYVKEILCVSSIFQQNNIIYKPANDTAKKIADKIMRGRRKVAENKSKTESSTYILQRYLSILSVAKVATLQESSKYNLFQLFDQMERYNAFLEWDVDQRVRLAGGKPEKNVESWMRDLYALDNNMAFTQSNTPDSVRIYN